jgi:phosphatidylglycerophosphate synthase
MDWFSGINRWGEKIRTGIDSIIRKIRPSLTAPVCRFLIRLHINQSHLTLSRFALLIGFYFAFIDTLYGLALGLALTAWIIDCLDGDLSRMLGHATALGEFEDVMADNFACLIFPLALIQNHMLKGVLGGLFIFAAFTVFWISNRNQPKDADGPALVFRPQGDVFLSLARKAIWIAMWIFLLFKINVFSPIFISGAIVLCLSAALNYFQIIRSRL